MAQHRKRRPCGEPCRAQPQGLQRPRCATWGCVGQTMWQEPLPTGACVDAMNECLVRDSAHKGQRGPQAWWPWAWSARHLLGGHSSTLRGYFRSVAAEARRVTPEHPGAASAEACRGPTRGIPTMQAQHLMLPSSACFTAQCQICSCLDTALPSMQVQQQSAAHCTSPKAELLPATCSRASRCIHGPCCPEIA